LCQVSLAEADKVIPTPPPMMPVDGMVSGLVRTDWPLSNLAKLNLPEKTMGALMIVLTLSAVGLMGWRLLKERKRSTRRRMIRQRHDAEASQNWKNAQNRARRATLG
jgi:hypothetical protein